MSPFQRLSGAGPAARELRSLWRAAKSWRRLGLSDPTLVRRFLVFEGPSDAKNLGEPDTEALEAYGVSGSRLAASRLAFFWSRLF